MNRREFLTSALATAVAAAAPSILPTPVTRKKVQVERLAEDRFELILDQPNKIRILQLTDTHFGRPNDEDRQTDTQTRKLIRALVDEQHPDFIFHTGDFINNDVDNPSHAAIDFVNDLGTPWSLVFGNHDHGSGQPGGLSLDEYYKRLENHATGYFTTKEGATSRRDYCFRVDIRDAKNPPVMTLIGFNTSGNGPMKVSEGQLAWFRDHLEADVKLGRKQPILVMQHIPMIQYRDVYPERGVVGRQGEGVCFEQDLGAAFEMYQASSRVRGVFCGHDHINDYIGDLHGVNLVYGRVTGWSGYGDWQRGGRIIQPSDSPRGFKTWVVLPKGVQERPEWSSTLGIS